MPREKANIKEILAANLRENRRKKGLTQEKLAELANMSLHYLAMLELAHKFPSGEMLEKLSKALDIQAYQLFYPTSTPEGAVLHLEQSIVDNIEGVVGTTIKQTIASEYKTQKDLISVNQPPKEELELLRRDIVNEINQTVTKAIKQSFAEESKYRKK